MKVSMLPKPLQVAAFMAEKSTYKQRLGACLVKHSKIISYGHNSLRHHKYSLWYNWPNQYHAETDVILRSNYSSLLGSHLFVVRINRLGETRLAKPCNSCMRLIRDHGIKRVTYTTNEGGYETTTLHHR